jgi:hypothetical protein
MDVEEFQKQFTNCAYISYETLMKTLEENKQVCSGEKIRKPTIGSKIVSGIVGAAFGTLLYLKILNIFK